MQNFRAQAFKLFLDLKQKDNAFENIVLILLPISLQLIHNLLKHYLIPRLLFQTIVSPTVHDIFNGAR